MALLDIEGAFKHTTVEIICIGTSDHSVANTVLRLLCHLLSMRWLEARWKHYTRRGLVSEGCPQGGVLYSILRCLVIDGLLILGSIRS